MLSQRRAAQRDGPPRRRPRDHQRLRRRVRSRRTRERPRRLLRDHARAHPADRGGRPRCAAAPGPRTLGDVHVVQRPRAVRRPARHRVRDGGRTPEHHGLEEVPASDRERRLPGGGGRRARTGPERREPARREHGHRPARRAAGDDDVPEPPGNGAGGRPRADHGRLVELGRDRGRAEVRPGQGRRELDQPEGGRGGFPREGPAREALRRRRRRDGLRRGGAGRHRRAQGRDLRARLPAAHRAGRLRPVGHHLRPEHPRDRHRDGGARGLRQGVHRRDPHHQAAPARREGLRRRLESLVRLPRERRRPRGDALGVPLPRAPGRARHGDRERRSAPGLRRHPEGPQGARRGPALQPA